MANSLLPAAERLLKNYLESSGSKGAIYDESMTLLWTNFHEFFDNFDIAEINTKTPLISESSISVDIEGVRAVMNITPVRKSPRVISNYVCVVRQAYDIYKLMNKTIISDFSNIIMKKYNERLERLADFNRAISDEITQPEGSNKLDWLVQSQEKLITSMRNESRFYMDTCFKEVLETGVPCNISFLLTLVCICAADKLKELKRKVNFSVPDKNLYISADVGPLILGFLHLLRAHVMLSPLKGSVSVNASVIEGTRLFSVSIKTSLISPEKISNDYLTAARIYRELAKKTIVYNYGGTFECNDSKKSMQTVFKITVSKKNRGPMLNVRSPMYDCGEKSAVVAYLLDIIYQEKNEGKV